MSATCSRCGSDADESARFCPTCGAALGDGEADLIGKVLARKYRVIDQIGEGSMGRIYRAEHLGLEKRVALKVLHREVVLGAEGLQRFRREGVAAGKLSHPNATEVYDFDVTEAGDAFLAMELVEGRDLRTVLEEDGSFDLDDAREVVLQALSALGHAHKSGIVHRDLKPENIMLVERGDEFTVKVLDFGLSKLIDTRVEASLATVPGRIIGTPYYMAPEQSSGEEADARTDLYALGVIFYELLAGQRPFTGRNLTELLYAQATQDVPSIRELEGERGLPAWVDDFIERALERNREDRYQSAEEMAEDLRDEEVDPRDGAPRRRAPAPARTSRTGSGGASTAAGRSRPSTRRREAAPEPARKAWVVPAAVAGIVAAAGLGIALFGTTLFGGSDSKGGPAAASSPRVRALAAAERDPAQINYLMTLDNARAQIQGGQIAGASSLVQMLMAMPQRDPEAYVVRALLAEAKGELDSAAADLRAAIAEDETYTEARVELAWLELERGNVDAAGPLFEELTTGPSAPAPVPADALAGRGAVLAAAGDAAGARAAFESAIAADSDSWRAHQGKASLALAAGAADEAIEAFVEAKRIHPQSREVLLGLARAYLATGRSDEAAAQYRAALDLKETDEAALFGLTAVQLDQGNFREVQRRLFPLVGAGKLEPNTRALLGLARAAMGDGESAMRSLRAAQEGGMTDARGLALLALLELGESDAQGAVRTATEALSLDDTLAEAHLARGLALFRLERYEAAEVALRSAVAADAGCTAALLALGDLGAHYLADNSRATADIEAYLAAGGKDPRAETWLYELGAR